MQSKDKKRRRILWIGLAVLSALLLLAIFRPKTPVVETAAVSRGDLTIDLSTTGVVEGDVADVSTKVVGKVVSIYVDEGDRVKTGQIVAILDSEELQADVERSRAALAAAQSQVSRALGALAGETRQVNAQIARARASVSAARARLSELQAGARPQEIREAQAAVGQAEAQAANARATLQRTERLYSRGAVSKAQLDEVRTASQVADSTLSAARERLALVRAGARTEQISAAQAEVRSAEAALAEAQAGRDLLRVREQDVRAAQAQASEARATLAAAESRLSQTIIKSPVTGSVVRKQAEVGETVSPGQPIITVASSGKIWVIAEVDQEDVAAVAEGQKVKINLDAYPNRYAAGLVTSVSTVAVPKEVGRVRAKIVRTRIELLENSLPLKPGIEVNIDGSLLAARNALLVPNDAIARVGDKDYVYVVKDNRAHRQQITPGLANFDYTTVRQGLLVGQVVAVSDIDHLSDGIRIRTNGVSK